MRWIDASSPDTGLVTTARIRAQHVAGLAGLLLGVPYSILFQLLGVRWSMPVMGTIALCIVGAVFVFTRRGKTRAGAWVSAWGAFAFIALALIARGGMQSNAAAWLLVAPLFATFIGGPRQGVISASATAATFALVWLAPELGFALPPPLPNELLKWMPLVDYPLIALLFGGMLGVQAGLWERAEKEALEAAHARYIFLATMSHEIRTPLNGVLGLAEVLLGTALTAEQRELAATIQRSGSLLRSVLDDVLDYSKIDSGHLEADVVAVDVQVLCGDVGRLWEGTAGERGLAIEVVTEAGAPRSVMTDANKLRQIVGNLVSNALKFTPRGTVRVELASASEGLTVRVRDPGIGMNAAQLQRIFEPFVQGDHSTTRRFGGTGLGLSICRRLARFLGGEITVESAIGAGSTFTVSLPLVPIAEPVNSMPTTEDETRSLRGLNVLVAEDNPVNQLVIRRLLERHGVEVRTASNGDECVRAWQAQAPDLILMDCQMPTCDGYEATRRIRHEGGSVPIIALTANAMAGDRARCVEAGMNDHLDKPVEPQLLARMLRSWTR
jgi:signal transduction histidine kinase